MKKIILTSAIIFATVAASFAQGPLAATGTTIDNVQLNVNLHQIQSITVNQKTVDLNYKTKDDYANGVESKQENHLNIYSMGSFAVTVKADDLKDNRGETIDASSISIKAEAGSSDPLSKAVPTEGKLTNDGTVIITSPVGGINKNFNITYKGAGGGDYVNKFFNDEKPTVYSTTVYYTIAAQ